MRVVVSSLYLGFDHGLGLLDDDYCTLKVDNFSYYNFFLFN